ncbi:MAG: universal stress protein [Myxococcota bacterium]
MPILVANDFTPEGNEATRVAAQLARATRESLVVVHVLEPRMTFPADGQPRLGDLPVVREAAAQKMLNAVKLEVGGDHLNVHTEIGHGAVEDALLDAVSRHAPQIAVVGGFGDGKASYNGIADSLAALLPCPVLVVRPSNQGLRTALADKRRLRVFLAIDRSLASDAPLGFLKWLRGRIACDVVVDYLYWPPVEHERLGVPAGEDPFAAHPTVVRSLEDELRARVGELPGQGELTFRAHPNIGSVEILAKRAARAFDSDLVIVGSHRRRGWSRLVHGSVSLSIMRNSDIPVLSVGHDVLQHSDAKARVHRVMVATDFSDVSRRVIAHALDLIGDRQGNLHVVFVDDSPMDGAMQRLVGGQRRLSSFEITELQEKIRGLLPEELDEDRIEITTKVLEGGPVADALIQEAARWNAEAICMSSRGVGTVERLLTGSVATEVVQRADCPVLVVRTRKD